MALRKLLYGALFAFVVPLLLMAWAAAAERAVPLPVPLSPEAGWALAAAGLVLLLAGMRALWVYGEGLPMNAFPPPKYVARGVYAFLPHPIYTGFCVLVAGAAIAAKSAAGLWLISPLVMLGCVALVLGYERPDLVRRFGELPRPRIPDRLSCYVLVLLPWVVLYEAIAALGVLPHARSTFLPFESRLPVIEWAEISYVSVYPAVCAVPWLARSRGDLRRFSTRVLLAMAIVFPLFLVFPLIAPPRPFTPHGPLGRLLAWERTLDTPAEAFPSWHVIFALLAAEAMRGRRWLWRVWALLVSVGCLATGMHSLIDVLGGFAVAALIARAGDLWEALRRSAERIANSWKEWQWHSVRLINHGAYAGAGSFLAIFIVGSFAGPGNDAAVLLAGVSALVFAALCAQIIEGSPHLLRPYGYYGGVLGVAAGALAAPLAGSSSWLVLAAFSVAGPWVQSLGRLRCLVQGCCHGAPAPQHIGIRYRHPRSRVCRLTGWQGLPLHPTPLYSILWNAFIALATARLWWLEAPLSLIVGLYLILAGLGRFVEEAYRGEPQTPVIARLRLYQWIAIGTVALGALLTGIPTSTAPSPQFRWEALLPAAAFGLLATFATGVDFPDSNRRFARLT